MSISSNLVQIKINPGGVAAFGQSLPILHPELSPCGNRYHFDQYGREADPNSIDTLTCPGFFSAEGIIENENSLRSFLSPKYFGLPAGISGGADTLFGTAGSAGRLIDFTKEIPIMVGGKNTNIGPGGVGAAADRAFQQAGLQTLGAATVVPEFATSPQGYIKMRYYNQ
jgi:hypothetical protein